MGNCVQIFALSKYDDGLEIAVFSFLQPLLKASACVIGFFLAEEITVFAHVHVILFAIKCYGIPILLGEKRCPPDSFIWHLPTER